jgi:hypothetical protein
MEKETQQPPPRAAEEVAADLRKIAVEDPGPRRREVLQAEALAILLERFGRREA